MAEHSFQEVMRQYKRMCCGKACSDCDFYKFKMSLNHQMACLRFLKEYPVEAEALVMNWATEHLEPVYPTWREYLQEQGILDVEYIPAASSTTSTSKSYVQTVKTLAPFYRPIPADIAQKLGLQPKEE
jgi:hypothetical protein